MQHSSNSWNPLPNCRREYEDEFIYFDIVEFLCVGWYSSETLVRISFLRCMARIRYYIFKKLTISKCQSYFFLKSVQLMELVSLIPVDMRVGKVSLLTSAIPLRKYEERRASRSTRRIRRKQTLFPSISSLLFFCLFVCFSLS
jgi:hypothetical protein